MSSMPGRIAHLGAPVSNRGDDRQRLSERDFEVWCQRQCDRIARRTAVAVHRAQTRLARAAAKDRLRPRVDTLTQTVRGVPQTTHWTTEHQQWDLE